MSNPFTFSMGSTTAGTSSSNASSSPFSFGGKPPAELPTSKVTSNTTTSTASAPPTASDATKPSFSFGTSKIVAHIDPSSPFAQTQSTVAAPSSTSPPVAASHSFSFGGAPNPTAKPVSAAPLSSLTFGRSQATPAASTDVPVAVNNAVASTPSVAQSSASPFASLGSKPPTDVSATAPTPFGASSPSGNFSFGNKPVTSSPISGASPFGALSSKPAAGTSAVPTPFSAKPPTTSATSPAVPDTTTSAASPFGKSSSSTAAAPATSTSTAPAPFGTSSSSGTFGSKPAASSPTSTSGASPFAALGSNTSSVTPTSASPFGTSKPPTVPATTTSGASPFGMSNSSIAFGNKPAASSPTASSKPASAATDTSGNFGTKPPAATAASPMSVSTSTPAVPAARTSCAQTPFGTSSSSGTFGSKPSPSGASPFGALSSKPSAEAPTSASPFATSNKPPPATNSNTAAVPAASTSAAPTPFGTSSSSGTFGSKPATSLPTSGASPFSALSSKPSGGSGASPFGAQSSSTGASPFGATSSASPFGATSVLGVKPTPSSSTPSTTTPSSASPFATVSTATPSSSGGGGGDTQSGEDDYEEGDEEYDDENDEEYDEGDEGDYEEGDENDDDDEEIESENDNATNVPIPAAPKPSPFGNADLFAPKPAATTSASSSPFATTTSLATPTPPTGVSMNDVGEEVDYAALRKAMLARQAPQQQSSPFSTSAAVVASGASTVSSTSAFGAKSTSSFFMGSAPPAPPANVNAQGTFAKAATQPPKFDDGPKKASAPSSLFGAPPASTQSNFASGSVPPVPGNDVGRGRGSGSNSNNSRPFSGATSAATRSTPQSAAAPPAFTASKSAQHTTPQQQQHQSRPTPPVSKPMVVSTVRPVYSLGVAFEAFMMAVMSKDGQSAADHLDDICFAPECALGAKNFSSEPVEQQRAEAQLLELEQVYMSVMNIALANNGGGFGNDNPLAKVINANKRSDPQQRHDMTSILATAQSRIWVSIVLLCADCNRCEGIMMGEQLDGPRTPFQPPTPHWEDALIKACERMSTVAKMFQEMTKVESRHADGDPGFWGCVPLLTVPVLLRRMRIVFDRQSAIGSAVASNNPIASLHKSLYTDLSRTKFSADTFVPPQKMPLLHALGAVVAERIPHETGVGVKAMEAFIQDVFRLCPDEAPLQVLLAYRLGLRYLTVSALRIPGLKLLLRAYAICPSSHTDTKSQIGSCMVIAGLALGSLPVGDLSKNHAVDPPIRDMVVALEVGSLEVYHVTLTKYFSYYQDMGLLNTVLEIEKKIRTLKFVRANKEVEEGGNHGDVLTGLDASKRIALIVREQPEEATIAKKAILGMKRLREENGSDGGEKTATDLETIAEVGGVVASEEEVEVLEAMKGVVSEEMGEYSAWSLTAIEILPQIHHKATVLLKGILDTGC